MSELNHRSPEGVISGSFKFKPEIDSAINEFRDLNVIIRAPEIGWLYVPTSGLIVATTNEQFQPLPNEQHMLAGEVEAAFLEQLDKSDFVYVMNPESYIGDMSIFEIGYTKGIKKPIYASNPINFHSLGGRDPKMIELLRTTIPVMTPAEAARDMHNRIAFLEQNYSNDRHSSPSIRSLQRDVSRFALPLPPHATHIAEGAIMRSGKRVMLVEDGRWKGEQLTIPGTRVRSSERRAAALERLIHEKIGADISSLTHFATSFMIPDSGYNGPVDADRFVFDDHVIDLKSEQIRPHNDIRSVWLSTTEVEELIDKGEIEPNATVLLTDYLEKAS